MKVAFIGLGTMGEAMATHVLKAGHRLTVHNRTRAREEGLASLGALRADSPAAAAAHAEAVLVCVSDTPDVREVILGENGVVHGARPGTVVVDMSTISPEATREIAAELAPRGIRMMDAPVSGGSEGARNATLTIMAGGAPEDMRRVRPLFEAMGNTVTRIGGVGDGQVAKAINQIVIAATYLGVAEGVALGIRAGLDMKKLVQALRGGAAGSWVLENRSENMIRDDYPLGFRVSLHRKDLRIALDSARALGVSIPCTALVEQLETGLLARGYGDEDVSALARSIRQLSGID